MDITKIKEVKSFGGLTQYFEHHSKITNTMMKFSSFTPSQNVTSAIIWLSGLTCTEENFITKSGIQNLLKDANTMVICPDTSPRGLDLNMEHESYDFGSGAGFYLNATTPDYSNHYKMYDYIKLEIINILKEKFNVTNISIMGHSMGGHGALVLGLREKELFKSVSAFSPIVNPLLSPWGEKAFKGYLGEDYQDEAKNYDATELVKNGISRDDIIFIDQGLSDEFLEKQLLTDNLIEVAKKNNQKLDVKFREGYDHSYFYISSFLHEHINFHLKALS